MGHRSVCSRALSSYKFTGLFICLTSFLNVLFCVTGGLLLYLDSISQIEKSVDEISAAEIQVNAARISQPFTDLDWMSRAHARQVVINGLRELSTLEALQDFLLKQQLSVLSGSRTLFSMGLVVAPQGPNATLEPAGFAQYVWWDPLTDPAYIERYGGDRVWLSGSYLPEYYGDPSCGEGAEENPPSHKRCSLTYIIDSEGVYQKNVYNYTDRSMYLFQAADSVWQPAIAGWQESGATFWRHLWLWESEDGTRHLYATFVRVLPSLQHPLFKDALVAINTYISFYNLFDSIDDDTEATMIAATMGPGGDNVVLASNIDLRLLSPDCRRSGRRIGMSNDTSDGAPCQVTLAELPPLYREAARVLNNTPHNQFRSVRLDGEGYWVRRVNIFTPQGRDLLLPIDLLWTRRHSTVQGKVDRALVNFVLFVLGSVALSTVGLVLLFFVTRGFARSMEHQVSLVQAAVDVTEAVARELSMYDVEEGGALLEGEAGSKLPAGLKAALRRLLHNLHEYKPYLPDAMMVRESDVDVASVEPPGLGHERPVVTICFTDIQSSTELWERHPQAMHTALRFHNEVMRFVASSCSGYEVKVIGDAFMLAFRAAEDGCEFALEVQVALVASKWPKDLLTHPLCQPEASETGDVSLWNGLRVRVGVNCGEVGVEKNPVTGRCDYFGQPVNVASRVESCLGKGGLSGVTDVVLGQLDSDAMSRLGDPVLIDLGARALKGVAEPVNVTVMLRQELAGRSEVLSGPSPRFVPHWRDRDESSVSTGSGHNPMRPRRDTDRSTASSGSSPMSRRPSLGARSNAVLLREGLSQRAATCATFRAHYAPAAQAPLSSLGPCLADLLESVELAADMTQGVVIGTMSLQCTVVWNGPRACADHCAQCLRASDNLRSRSADIAVGACSGELLHGNVSAGRKKHATVVGGCVELSAALAEEAEACDEELLAATTFALYCRSLQRTRRFGKWSVRGGPGCFEVLSVSEPVAMAELAELRLDVVDGAENNGGADSTCLESLDDPKVLPVNDSDSEPTEPAGRQVLVGAGVATGGIGFD